jgi:peroxiredoxin Q/BCP
MAELKKGDTAPEFTLDANDGQSVSLVSQTGHKVILYAYPAAFTPGCSLEAQDFRDGFKSFDQAGYAVFGLSPDPVEKNASFAAKMKLPFELLSDPDHKVLEAYGAWGERESFGRKSIGVIRSTFVIGDDGRIELAEYQVKAAGHVERLAASLGLELDDF